MANFESSLRIGRSQGAIIFWGLVSACFALATFYFYWKDQDDETNATKYYDSMLSLQQQSESLNSQKDELQANVADRQKQLDLREEFLQDKETKLAQEESRLESLGGQPQSQTDESQSQSATEKKFDTVVRKISKNLDDAEVVARVGRPVLRVPAGSLFLTGDATLTHDGKALLGQIAQALDGQLGTFELRIDNFTDGDAEISAGDPGTKPDKKKDANAAPKTVFASGWDLTAARATAISRYFRDETSLPFENVIVVARGDFQPVIPNGKEGHARNRRVEITIAPVAPAYHESDGDAPATTNKAPAAPVDPLAPPPDKPTQ